MRGIEFHGFGTTAATVTTAPETFVARAMMQRASTRAFAYSRQLCNDPRSMPSPGAFVRGMFNIPRVTMGLPESAVSVSNVAGFGDIHIGCSELDTVIGQIKVLKSRLAGNSVGNSWNASADAFLDQFDTYFRVAWSTESCKNAVDTGQALVSQGNVLVSASGGAPVPLVSPDINPQNPVDNALDKLKPIAIAGAVIAGVFGLIYLAGPFLRRL